MRMTIAYQYRYIAIWALCNDRTNRWKNQMRNKFKASFLDILRAYLNALSNKFQRWKKREIRNGLKISSDRWPINFFVHFLDRPISKSSFTINYRNNAHFPHNIVCQNKSLIYSRSSVHKYKYIYYIIEFIGFLILELDDPESNELKLGNIATPIDLKFR